MNKKILKNKKNQNFLNEMNIKKNLNERYFGKDITDLVLNKKTISNDNKENNKKKLIQRKNPQLVEEYEEEIFKYLKLSINSIYFDNNYLANNDEIDSYMREYLIDWMIDVHEKFGLSQDCLFKSINILDITLSQKEVNRNQLQLVSVASMFISAKFEEIYPIKLSDFIIVCDSAYTKEQILNMESEILNILNFNLQTPNYTHFINKIIKNLNLKDKAFHYSNYLIEQSLINYSMLKYNFFNLLSGIFFLINKIFNKSGYTKQLKNIFNIEESLVKSCAKELFNLENNQNNPKITAIKRKYSKEKYLEISKYKIEKS